jgi:hypothetical protein
MSTPPIVSAKRGLKHPIVRHQPEIEPLKKPKEVKFFNIFHEINELEEKRGT